MISTIAWAVQPLSQTENRPRRLVEELTLLGAIRDPRYIYHGSTSPQPGHVRAPRLNPGAALRTVPGVAVLSPLFLGTDISRAAWVDLYDDWSLAPDIHPVNRAIAYAGYRKIKDWTGSRNFPMTVNSTYMANKVGKGAVVVPNGVNADLWQYETSGSEANRLIILGHFFKGRTDFDLIDRVVRTGIFEQVVIGGLGTDRSALNLVHALQEDFPGRILVENWITPLELAGYVGENTVSLIPNVVSDYTLSQDLMKAYTFLGLGLGIICPRMLWPSHLPIEDVYLVGHGDKLAAHLKSWLAQRRVSVDLRQDFCAEHSWAQRAQKIVEVLN